MRDARATSKKNSTVFFIFSIIVVGIFITNSQTVVYYSICKQKYALVNVSKTYERVIEKGYDSIQMREYLGNYYKIKDFQKSKLYFDMLFKKYKLSNISLKSIERYKTL